ncbi:alpha-tubulin suppressor-like RCC1 family protein [Microbacterium sp. 1154]|uniref:ricin-type beta-trefoil lectin domain protein n=1 Tax=Microbacterium sp. 1154 TaxID=2817733 RepID=UPI000E3AC1D8|nr:ricin-type beta-trefoil lectin domain protein [Microbacterium sp. 1154]MDR6689694.1 alpha-tubulin suppressor-like RCC1 family protein [Microbacterium sp. 1154]
MLLALAIVAIATSTIGAGQHTQAWFTSAKSLTDNSFSAASIQPVASVRATTRLDGANISWDGVLGQTWATANAITQEPTFTVTRTIDGGQPTTVYTGSATSASDSFPRASVTRGRSTVSAGTSVSGAISQGRVYTWGKDPGTGQLGTGGSSASTPTLINIAASHTVVDLSIGDTSAVAVASDNTVWAWGSGVATNCDSATNTPTQIPVPGGKTIVAVAAQRCQSLLLASDGIVYSYSGSTGLQTAAALPGGRKIVQITKGNCVLASDGTVWCRGSNNYGQLGTGSSNSSSDDFVQVTFRTGLYATQLASNGTTVVALLNNNSVVGWGRNSNGQLGNGSTSDAVSTPVSFKGLGSQEFIKVSVGGSHVSAVAADGTLSSAGLNASGQLGNGSTTSSSSAVLASGSDIPNFADVVDGGSQTYGVTSSGALWGWGANLVNGVSTIGNGNTSTTSYTSPVRTATNITIDDGANKLTCANGATANKIARCAPSGTLTYSVTYAVQSWVSGAVSKQASTTATQLGSVTFGGPGSLALCLGLRGGSSADYTPVELQACDSSANQTWSSWSDGTFRSNGKCLDVKGNSPGSVVQLWPCNDLGYQWWVLRDDKTVYNPSSGLCLTDPNGSSSPGTQQVIDTCTGATNQQWSF